jgi:hypothetical protein
MRGRVSAVNMAFINASNELGEFESGVTAALFGTVPAVVIGGAGTLAVVAIWSLLFPELRKLEDLTSAEPPPNQQAQATAAGASRSGGSPARSAASPSSTSPPLPDTAADSPLPAASLSAHKPPARSK